MADLGHDIYLTNNRGNSVSTGHIEFDPFLDAREYWDFSLDGFAEDVIASAKVMYDNAGTGKGYYFGYSQGTVQAVIATATRESEMAQYFNKIVLLAPCFGTFEGFDSSLVTDLSKMPGYVY